MPRGRAKSLDERLKEEAHSLNGVYKQLNKACNYLQEKLTERIGNLGDGDKLTDEGYRLVEQQIDFTYARDQLSLAASRLIEAAKEKDSLEALTTEVGDNPLIYGLTKERRDELRGRMKHHVNSLLKYLDSAYSVIQEHTGRKIKVPKRRVEKLLKRMVDDYAPEGRKEKKFLKSLEPLSQTAAILGMAMVFGAIIATNATITGAAVGTAQKFGAGFLVGIAIVLAIFIISKRN